MRKTATWLASVTSPRSSFTAICVGQAQNKVKSHLDWKRVYKREEGEGWPSDCFNSCSHKQRGRDSVHRHDYVEVRAQSSCSVFWGPAWGESSMAVVSLSTAWPDPLSHLVQGWARVELSPEVYDTIVDTTYTLQCRDIVTQHCSSVSQQVSQRSAIVG